MSDTHLVLIFVLATMAVVMLAWLTLFSVVAAKSRIIREQRKALEGEQRLRLAQEAFTDNAHHELRTPLQVLAGHLQMARDLSSRPDQVAALDQAQETTARLGHLVQGLLDFSSLAQGTLSMRTEPTDLGAHLALLAGNLKTQAQAQGLTVRVALDTLPAPLFCDAARLCQALEALIDNALGFTERGTVAFGMKAHPDGRAWNLRFEIQDQGPGLPPDWERLLKPFEQEERSLRRRRGGLGIGLPLAAGLIGLMGGRMGLVPLATGTLAWVEVRLEEAEG